MFPKRHWWLMAGYVFMLIASGFIPVGLFFIFDQDPFSATIYTNIISFSIFLVILLFFMQKDLENEKIKHPLSALQILSWTILGMLLALFSQSIAALIEIYIFGILPESDNTELIVKLSELNPFFIIIPALIGPIIEELVFRKILFAGFLRKMNFFFAALLSSVIFAAFHFDFTHLLIYTVMGFVFSFLYYQTKRIIIPIFAHMAMNSFVVYNQLFGEFKEPASFEPGIIFSFLQNIGG